MRSGVSYPSYAALPSYAMVSGSANASFPVSNLSDLYNLRTVFQATASGVVAFTFTFPSAQLIQFLGLLHHNGPPGSTVRWRLYSDVLTTQILDTGTLSLVTSSLFPQCFPYKMASALSVRSGRVDLSSNAVAWIIGAMELAGWWEWQDVGVGREIGFEANDTVVQQPFNVDHAMSSFSPRAWTATRALTDQSENLTTFQDFQLFATKTAKPFVFCWDIADLDDVCTKRALRGAQVAADRSGDGGISVRDPDLQLH